MSAHAVEILCSDGILCFLSAADLLRLECVSRRLRLLPASEEGARAWARATSPLDRPQLMRVAFWRKLASAAAAACAFDPIARLLIRTYWPSTASLGGEHLAAALHGQTSAVADVPLQVSYQADALAHDCALHSSAAFLMRAGAWAVRDDQHPVALDLVAGGFALHADPTDVGDSTVEEGFYRLAASFGRQIKLRGLRAAVGWLAFDLQAHLIAEWHAAEAASAATPAAVAAATPPALFERVVAPLLGSCRAYTALPVADRRAVDSMLGAAPTVPARPAAHFKICLVSGMHYGMPAGQCCHGDSAAVAAWDVLARPRHNLLALVVERIVVPRLGYQRCLGVLVAALGDNAIAAAMGVAPRTAVSAERQLSLVGDEVNYDSLVNSLLDTVLLRGKGLPLSLSVLYAAIGSRAGIPGMSCAALPGHVVVRCDGNKAGPYAKAFTSQSGAEAAASGAAGAPVDDYDGDSDNNDDDRNDDDDDDDAFEGEGDAAAAAPDGSSRGLQPLILLDAFRGGVFLQSVEGPIMPRDMGIPAAASLWVRSLNNMRASMMRHSVTNDHDTHVSNTAWLQLCIFLGAELATRKKPGDSELARGAAALRASLGLAAFGGSAPVQAAGRSRRSSTRGAAMAPTEAPALQSALSTLLASLSASSSRPLPWATSPVGPGLSGDSPQQRFQPWMHAMMASAHLRGGMSRIGGAGSSSDSSIADSPMAGALTPLVRTAHALSLRVLEIIRSDARLLRLAPALAGGAADTHVAVAGASVHRSAPPDARDDAKSDGCDTADSICAADACSPALPDSSDGGAASSHTAAATSCSTDNIASGHESRETHSDGGGPGTAGLPCFSDWQQAARLHPGHIQHKRAAVAVYLLFRFLNGLDADAQAPIAAASGRMAASSFVQAAASVPSAASAAPWVPYPDTSALAAALSDGSVAAGAGGSVAAAYSASDAASGKAARDHDAVTVSMALLGVRAILDGVYDRDIEQASGLWRHALFGTAPRRSAVWLGQRPAGASALEWTALDRDHDAALAEGASPGGFSASGSDSDVHDASPGRVSCLGLVHQVGSSGSDFARDGTVAEQRRVSWPDWPIMIAVSAAASTSSLPAQAESGSTAEAASAEGVAVAATCAASGASSSADADAEAEAGAADLLVPLPLGTVVTLQPHLLKTAHGRWAWHLSSPLLAPNARLRPHTESMNLWGAVLGVAETSDAARELLPPMALSHAATAPLATLCGRLKGDNPASDSGRAAAEEDEEESLFAALSAVAPGFRRLGSSATTASRKAVVNLGASAVLASAVPPYACLPVPHRDGLARTRPTVRLLPLSDCHERCSSKATGHSRLFNRERAAGGRSSSLAEGGSSKPAAVTGGISGSTDASAGGPTTSIVRNDYDASYAHACPCVGGGLRVASGASAAAETDRGAAAASAGLQRSSAGRGAAAAVGSLCSGHSRLLPGGHCGLLPVLNDEQVLASPSATAAGAAASASGAIVGRHRDLDAAREEERHTRLAVYFQSSNAHAHWIGAFVEPLVPVPGSAAASSGGAGSSDCGAVRATAAPSSVEPALPPASESVARLVGFVPSLETIAAAPRGAPLLIFRRTMPSDAAGTVV